MKNIYLRGILNLYRKSFANYLQIYILTRIKKSVKYYFDKK